MIEVEAPDGTIVEFPDGTDAAVMEQAMRERFGAPTSEPGVVEDVGKSLTSGIARGAADLIGLPGSIADAMNSGVNWTLRKGYELATGEEANYEDGGIEKMFAKPPPEVAERMRNPLSGDKLRGHLSTITGGATDYQPQSVAGEYARTIGEFAPSMMAAPGTLVQKSLLTAVPAVTSESAGQLTKGSDIEPYARVAGALAGGLAATPRPNAAKLAAKKAPTPEALKQQTDELYTGMRELGIKYDADSYASTVQRIAEKLMDKGFRPVGELKEAFQWVDELASHVGKSADFSDMEALVQQINASARAASSTPGKQQLGKALRTIRNELFEFQQSAPFVSAVPVGRGALQKMHSSAKQLARRNIIQRTMDEIVQNADTYAAGTEAGLRNGIRNFARSKFGKQILKESERKALLEVANGRKPLQTLSRFGFDLRSINGNASFLPAAGAYGSYSMTGDLVTPMLLAGAGTAAKSLSPYLTSKSMQRTMAAIRSGTLDDPTVMNAIKQQRAQGNIRRVLSGVPAAARLPYDASQSQQQLSE